MQCALTGSGCFYTFLYRLRGASWWDLGYAKECHNHDAGPMWHAVSVSYSGIQDSGFPLHWLQKYRWARSRWTCHSQHLQDLNSVAGGNWRTEEVLSWGVLLCHLGSVLMKVKHAVVWRHMARKTNCYTVSLLYGAAWKFMNPLESFLFLHEYMLRYDQIFTHVPKIDIGNPIKQMIQKCALLFLLPQIHSSNNSRPFWSRGRNAATNMSLRWDKALLK